MWQWDYLHIFVPFQKYVFQRIFSANLIEARITAALPLTVAGAIPQIAAQVAAHLANLGLSRGQWHLGS